MESELQASIVQYLRSKLGSVADPDALSVGIDVLVEAFGIPSPAPSAADLLAVFTVGRRHAVTSSPLFSKFLESLKTKGFFDGVAEGSPEYQERFAKVVAKFEARLSTEGGGASAPAAAAAAASSTSPAVAAAPAPAPVSTAADEAGAEASKEEGNRHVAAARYAQAVECYTDAIEKAPRGRNAHIYYSNRAAARTHLKDLEGAVEDARLAIATQPSYAKAHVRLATALQLLGRFSAAKDAWEEVLRLEPASSAAAEGVATCQSKLRSGAASEDEDDDASSDAALGATLPGAGGFPGMGGGMPGGFPGMPGGFPGMPGGFPGMGGGGMPDMSELLRNPGALAGIMQNPQFAAMAQGLMSNPAMMQQVMSMMGGLGGRGGGSS